jgi:membrane-bound lytic murein transglycosylase D
VAETATYARRITRYKVHRGDTVEIVAENFGVPPTMVRRWNGIRGDSLSGRKVLALHLPVTPSHGTEVAVSPSSKSKHHTPAAQSASAKAGPKTTATESQEEESAQAVIRHKVKSGETLYSIANAYKTTVAALKRDNRNIAVLHPGMVLVVQHP